MTTTACDDQFAPDPSSLEAALDAMAMEVQPHEWRQGGSMRYRGHTITWGEYVQRRKELEEEFTVEPWPEERMDVIGTNGPTGDHYAEDNDSEAVRERTIEDVVADWQAAHPEVMARSKYHREVKPGVWIDVYDVLQAWDVKNPADAHAIKKMLMPGTRGSKDGIQDRREAIQSIERAIQLEETSL